MPAGSRAADAAVEARARPPRSAARPSGDTCPEQQSDTDEELDRLLGEHYEEFETAFRGSREIVLERQKVGLDYALPLRSLNVPSARPRLRAGEWLELLGDHDLEAYGVDMNERFVEENRERGLDVRHEDALEHLRGQPEASLAGVSAFT